MLFFWGSDSSFDGKSGPCILPEIYCQMMCTDLCIGFHSRHGWELKFGSIYKDFGFVHNDQILHWCWEMLSGIQEYDCLLYCFLLLMQPLFIAVNIFFTVTFSGVHQQQSMFASHMLKRWVKLRTCRMKFWMSLSLIGDNTFYLYYCDCLLKHDYVAISSSLYLVTHQYPEAPVCCVPVSWW